MILFNVSNRGRKEYVAELKLLTIRGKNQEFVFFRDCPLPNIWSCRNHLIVDRGIFVALEIKVSERAGCRQAAWFEEKL